MEPGDDLPDFELPTNGGKQISKADLLGQWTVLYFYPKDNTPGCTKQAVGFTEHKSEFDSRNARILGVSRDSAASHDRFVEKQNLSIDLASDESGEFCEAMGVWVEKKMYGKTFMGIERTTFLVNPDGKIEKVWRKVRVKDHIEQVLHALDEFG